MVSVHSEGTFGRLRYPFGGDRPSQTPRLALSHRRVTADALGPRTVQKVFVTMGPRTVPVQGIRPVAALAPGVSGDTGLTLRQLAAAMVDAVRPAALICVDSLCSAEAARLGRTIQFSDWDSRFGQAVLDRAGQTDFPDARTPRDENHVDPTTRYVTEIDPCVANAIFMKLMELEEEQEATAQMENDGQKELDEDMALEM